MQSVPPGTGAGPKIPLTKAGVRAKHTLEKTYNYTLSVKPFPSGFNPPCQESNITMWALTNGTYAQDSDHFSFVGLQQPDINVAACNAATGDSMHALLEISYGNMRFIATGNGNFKLDSVDDSGGLLTITDNTTGYSSNALVYVSY